MVYIRFGDAPPDGRSFNNRRRRHEAFIPGPGLTFIYSMPKVCIV
jgi:hypothetical protein